MIALFAGLMVVQSNLPSIGKVVPPEAARQHDVAEIVIEAKGAWDNPFDPEQVRLDAAVTSPSGAVSQVPGFYAREYDRKLEAGKEVLSPRDSGTWRVRVYPAEPGKYRLTLLLQAGTNRVTREVSFEAKASTGSGFVKVDDTDHRYFTFQDGSPFYPIGANICWGGDRGTFSYDEWMADYGKEGTNWGRLWLSPAWTTFALETVGKREEAKGLGFINLEGAWKLDYVLGLAKKQGMYLQLCIDSYNILRDRDAYPFWEETPHNRDRGGPLRIWSDFWTDPKMDQNYRNKLRYLVARYGAYPQVLAWEFWNEVDLTRDFEVPVVRDWHRRMAKHLREIDPYRHLITTSTANTMGYRDLELIPELDFVQTHHYNNPDLAATVAYQQSRKSGWGKAHFFGEIGADASGPRGSEDTEGHQMHDPLWASIATGASGGAMAWWWDSWIAPLKLYPVLGAASRFVKGIRWHEEGFRQVDVSFAYQQTPKTPRRTDLIWEGGPVPWSPGPGARAQKVLVEEGVSSGDVPAGIQHGLRNHLDLHNPLTFVVTSKRPLRFEVAVGDVSGYGGARLQMRLNGLVVADKNFADPDDNAKVETLKQYAGRYSIDIPAGQNKVVVENLGNDWFMASYRLVGAVEKRTPPLQGWAISGENTAVAWVRVEGRSWKNVASLKVVPPSAAPSVVALPGLAAGTWTAELYDTWVGKTVSQRRVVVGTDGKARVMLPVIARDLAIKLRRGP